MVLPDHLHAILTLPADDADFPARWRRIKGYFSARLLDSGTNLKRHANGELALWQRRYWEHTIRDDDDFSRHVDYIHYNPVKHRLVRRVRDWPHSSFHLYVRRGCCRKIGRVTLVAARWNLASGSDADAGKRRPM